MDSSRRCRIVALLPAGPVGRLGLVDFESVANNGFSLVRTSSGYEAAAELLSGPTSVLLIDATMLTAAHVSLLNLATELKIPMVAFGAILTTLNGSALAGVRMVAPERVSETIHEFLSGPEVVQTINTPEAEDAAYQAESPERQETSTTRKPIQVLTQEDLKALLGDEP